MVACTLASESTMHHASSVRTKALYLIGGGPLALKTFTWAREAGLSILMTDMNPSAPGREFANEFRCISAKGQHENHFAFAKEMQLKYDICCVYCGNEIGTENVALIQRSVGLPYLSQKVILSLKNKEEMKEALNVDSIRSPKHWILKDIEALHSILKDRTQNLVIKPNLGSGSRGVKIIHKADKIHPEQLWQECTAEVEDEDYLIAEEFIDGISIDVNAIIHNEKFLPAGILEKYITSPPYCLPLGGHAPAEITEAQETDIFSILQQACQQIGVNTGPVKADFIICSKTGKPYLLELAARFHGDITTCNTLPFSIGVNPLKALFSLCTTDDSGDWLKPRSSAFATWRVMCLPPGQNYADIFSNENGETEGISVIWFNHKHTTDTKQYNNTRHIPGYICAYGKNEIEANKKIEDYFNNIKAKMPSLIESEWYTSLGHSVSQLGKPHPSFCYINGEAQ